MLSKFLSLGAFAILCIRQTTGFPLLDSRQDQTVPNSTADISAGNTSITNPNEANTFEYYLNSGFNTIAPPGNTHLIRQIYVRPFPNIDEPSKHVEDFIGLKINYLNTQTGTDMYTFNWRAKSVGDLTDWSLPAFDPRRRRLAADFETFPRENLPMTMRTAFQRLRTAGFGIQTWQNIVIAKLKTVSSTTSASSSSSSPHAIGVVKVPDSLSQGEIFFAFHGSTLSRPTDWIYVGSQTGRVVRDEDPFVVAERLPGSLSGGLGSLANATVLRS